MSSPAIQDFNQKFAQSAELRQKIRQVDSVPQLLTLLQEWGCTLTGPEVVALAQQAYQTWLALLDPATQPFFVAAHTNPALNQAIETCRHSNDVIALAQAHGFQLAEADLQAAATAADQIEGFSFEKLWFKGLGLLA
jgi:predicted ribosomally synthesized peptide with nif11-like leader